MDVFRLLDVPDHVIYRDSCGELISEETHERDLDPIDNAGCLDTEKLRETARNAGMKWAEDGMRVLSDKSFFKRRVLLPEAEWRDIGRIGTKTRHSLLGILVTLTAAGVLHVFDVSRWHVMCMAALFLVPKGIDRWRVVVDCRPLNARCASPPPVNLVDLPTLLRLIRPYRWFVTADYRHWFYQMPLADSLRPWFTVGLERDAGVWALGVLAMGWSWAPYVSLCAAYAILCGEQSSLKHGVRVEVPKDGTVPYVKIFRNGKMVGIALIFYDNFLLATEDFLAAHEVREMFIKNSRRHGAQFKEDPTPIMSRATMLGIDLDVRDGTLHWSHTQKRKVAAREAAQRMSDRRPVTPRMVAGVVGLMVWHSVATFTPLFRMAHLFDILANVQRTQGVKNRADWRKEFDLPLEARVQLQAACNVIADSGNFTFPADEPITRNSVTIACDASNLAVGGVVCNGENEGRFFIRRFDKGSTRSHIFIKELLGALWSLQWAIEQGWVKPLDAVEVLIDNRAAMYALRRLYSRNKDANKIIQRVEELARANQLKLVFEPIDTARNPADEPSRGRVPQKNKISNAMILTLRVNRKRVASHPHSLAEAEDALMDSMCSMGADDAGDERKDGPFFDEKEDGAY
jgi:hypothetical protein